VAALAVLVPLALGDPGVIPGTADPVAPYSSHPAGHAAASATAYRHSARPRSHPHATPPPPALPQATITLAANATATPVPSSYFGISTEYWALPLFDRNMPVFERVLSLLHVRGDGPLVLRIGGDSADHSFWHPRWKKLPQWAFELTPTLLKHLGALVRRDRVKLIVDLNLVTDTPFTAAAWAHAAETSLPRGSIVGFEIGNEPDLYSHRYWVATVARSPFLARPLPLELTPASYVQDFAAYSRVIGETAPDIPLIGPAVAHPRISVRFVSTLIGAQRSELHTVTGHVYPYSACVKRPRSASYPTVERLLSPQATSAMGTDIAPTVAVAHANGLKFRMTEFNSVTCGGKAGVSDTFATALWAPDALFTMLRAGADGVNLHVRATAINAAFAISRGGLHPRPLLYGLMLFNRTLGPQASVLRLQQSGTRALNLSAWAVRVRGDILHVLLINKGNRTAQVHLHLPASAPASVQRMLAPSAYSRSGVTLNGQQLNWAGYWAGTQRTETITPGVRGYQVTVPRRSAALVGVSLRPPARPVVTATTIHSTTGAVSKHHRGVAVAKHSVLAVGLHRSRKH
jgi:Glycosyl hydrolase family 79 C-terminal beta domain